MAMRPATLLIVDDDPIHVALVRTVFKRNKIFNTILHAGDGVEAFALLRNPAQPRPSIILLDLNMPGMGGREFLTEIKQDPALLTIPVLVMSSSQSPEDVDDSYRNHCNGYLVKPVGVDAIFQIARALSNFWVELVVLPPSDGPNG